MRCKVTKKTANVQEKDKKIIFSFADSKKSTNFAACKLCLRHRVVTKERFVMRK